MNGNQTTQPKHKPTPPQPFEDMIVLIGSQAWADYGNGKGTAWLMLKEHILKTSADFKPFIIGKNQLDQLGTLKIFPKEQTAVKFFLCGEPLSELQKTALCFNLATNTKANAVGLYDNLGNLTEKLSGEISRIREQEQQGGSVAKMIVEATEAKKEPYIEYREKKGLSGLYYIKPKIDNQTGEVIREDEKWICDNLTLLGQGFEGNQSYYVFKFIHPNTNKPIIEPILFSEFGCKSGWDKLADLGLKITAKPYLNELVEHFHRQSNSPTLQKYCITTQTGWQNSSYLLPSGEILGDKQTPVLFKYKNSNEGENPYTAQNSVQQWQEQVARYAAGNWAIMLAVATSLSAPLLKKLDLDSFGVHLYNDSSKGKTTALYVANSIWGNPKGVLKIWNNTENAILSYAEQQNDGLLSLDELGQVKDFKELEKIAYSLFNETGRGRLTKDLAQKAIKRWKITALSTGERGLEDFLASNGRPVHTGQLVRLLNIPTGDTEQFHGLSSAREHAEHLKEQSMLNYGAVGREWVKFIAENMPIIEAEYRNNRQKWGEKTSTHSSQVQRVAVDRFALLETALNLAMPFTGWTKESNQTAINKAFSEWLAIFGERSKTESKIIERINGFLLENAETAFYQVINENVTNKDIKNVLGYRYLENTANPSEKERFYIFTHSFKQKLKENDDLNLILKTLESVKMTIKGNEENKPFLHKISAKIDKNRPRCYLIFRLDESQEETQ